MSPAFPDTSRADPPYLQGISAEFSEYRKLWKSYLDLTMQEFDVLKFYLEAKRFVVSRFVASRFASK